MTVNHARIPWPAHGEPARIVVDRRCRDPDPRRPRPDGGGERPGVPASGPPLRRGAHLLADPELAVQVTAAVASAVDVPVTVKMRRGVEDGSRSALELAPRLVDAGAAALTIHPRSARQMYTGYADHTLTAELVELVDVPVIASGDVTSKA